MLIAALSAVVALFAFSAAACKKNKGNVAGELTFRHFDATATAELGEMFLLNSNNAVDGRNALLVYPACHFTRQQ